MEQEDENDNVMLILESAVNSYINQLHITEKTIQQIITTFTTVASASHSTEAKKVSESFCTTLKDVLELNTNTKKLLININFSTADQIDNDILEAYMTKVNAYQDVIRALKIYTEINAAMFQGYDSFKHVTGYEISDIPEKQLSIYRTNVDQSVFQIYMGLSQALTYYKDCTFKFKELIQVANNNYSAFASWIDTLNLD